MILEVKNDSFKYDIIIEEGSLNNLSKYLNVNEKYLVITDTNVEKLYLQKVLSQLPNSFSFVIEAGEESKNIDNYLKINEQLIKHEFTRSDSIIALGGGVVGDLSAFAASTFKRGIKFYNFPTTLLSQIDSSIGGKTAIDFNGIKNVIGSFYQPSMVLIDSLVLNTLDERNKLAGLVEAIKMAATFNKDLFEMIETTNIFDNINYLIYEALKIKKDVVEKDPKEKGLRRVLNFGHTFGHAYEASECYGKLIHGECVGLGMIDLSFNDANKRIINILKKYNLPLFTGADFDVLLPYLTQDKKSCGKEIYTILVEEIGSFKEAKLTIDELRNIYKK